MEEQPLTEYKTFKGIYIKSTNTYYLCDVYEGRDGLGARFYNVQVDVPGVGGQMVAMRRLPSGEWRTAGGELSVELERRLSDLINAIQAPAG